MAKQTKQQLRNTTLKKGMVVALEKSLGVVTTACKTVGIERSTHYNWMKEDEGYRASVISLEDLALDFAESQLHKQIKDGNTAATIFLLKCKGKKRGYIENAKFTISLDEEFEKDESMLDKLTGRNDKAIQE